MYQRKVCSIQLFIPNGQLAKPVKPGVASFHDPAVRLTERIQGLFLLLRTTRAHMRLISGLSHTFCRCFARVTGIGAEVLHLVLHDGLGNFVVQQSLKLTYVMPVGSGHDDG